MENYFCYHVLFVLKWTFLNEAVLLKTKNTRFKNLLIRGKSQVLPYDCLLNLAYVAYFFFADCNSDPISIQWLHF